MLTDAVDPSAVVALDLCPTPEFFAMQMQIQSVTAFPAEKMNFPSQCYPIFCQGRLQLSSDDFQRYLSQLSITIAEHLDAQLAIVQVLVILAHTPCVPVSSAAMLLRIMSDLRNYLSAVLGCVSWVRLEKLSAVQACALLYDYEVKNHQLISLGDTSREVFRFSLTDNAAFAEIFFKEPVCLSFLSEYLPRVNVALFSNQEISCDISVATTSS